MEYRHKSKILITGPTGTGTTFLMGLLHHLGFASGYTSQEVDNVIHGRGKGLEFTRARPTRNPWLEERKKDIDISPKVIKHPIQDYGDDGGTGRICNVLDVAEDYGWDVRYLFVTVRKLNSIVESVQRRMRTGDAVMFKIKGDEAARQRELLAAEGMYNLVLKLASSNYPYTLIEFPKSVDEPEYCYSKVHPILECGREEFLRIHAKVADKGMVHVR